MTKSRRKVIDDFKKGDSRFKDDIRLEWKVRYYLNKVEYWLVAYTLPISLLILVITGDFWKAFVFWFATQIYVLSANIRGLTTHIEGFIEWTIEKTI